MVFKLQLDLQASGLQDAAGSVSLWFARCSCIYKLVVCKLQLDLQASSLQDVAGSTSLIMLASTQKELFISQNCLHTIEISKSLLKLVKFIATCEASTKEFNVM